MSDWISQYLEWIDYRPSRCEQAYILRNQGLTFRQIGVQLGVSANRARQLWLSSPEIKALRNAEFQVERDAERLEREAERQREIAHKKRIAEIEANEIQGFLAKNPDARVYPSGIPWGNWESERDSYLSS